MTPSEMLLQKLANAPGQTGRQTVTVTAANGWTVELSAEHVDVVGCKLQELAVKRNAPVELKPWSESVAKRVTGLLEPLKLLELEASQGTALLRSETPAKRGETRAYYEVTLRQQGEATLRRYQATMTGKREQIPFTLTHDALGKLVDDLTA
jgi:hypothetical protein